VCNAFLLCGSLCVLLLLLLLDNALYALSVVVCGEPWLDQHGRDLQAGARQAAKLLQV